MKKIWMFALAVMSLLPVIAQEKGNTLALAVVVEDLVEPFPANAKVQVQGKLTDLLTRNGVASTDYLGQFFITAVAVPQQKEVVPGPPTQIVEIVEFRLYIADYWNQVVFASTSLTSKGVGTNETKCYMDALRHLNTDAPALRNFVAEGRAKIIDWYNAQAGAIFAKAKSLAAQKDYEQAIFLVTAIPSECDKYQQSLDLADTFYQAYIDHLCDINLAQAKAVWASSQNAMGAEEAGAFLSKILPDAKCYGDAEQLYKEIKAKVLDDWHFEMKKYQDGVDLERARINAIRDVGVAYGSGQQPTTTNLGFIH